MNRYYSTQRPVDIGTCPTDGLIRHVNYDTRTFVDCIARRAWGYVEYNRELTPQEISNYELVPEPPKSGIRFSEYELWTISECILTKIAQLETCREYAVSDGLREAIRREQNELQALNDRICRAAEEV